MAAISSGLANVATAAAVSAEPRIVERLAGEVADELAKEFGLDEHEHERLRAVLQDPLLRREFSAKHVDEEGGKGHLEVYFAGMNLVLCSGIDKALPQRVIEGTCESDLGSTCRKVEAAHAVRVDGIPFVLTERIFKAKTSFIAETLGEGRAVLIERRAEYQRLSEEIARLEKQLREQGFEEHNSPKPPLPRKEPKTEAGGARREV